MSFVHLSQLKCTKLMLSYQHSNDVHICTDGRYWVRHGVPSFQHHHLSMTKNYANQKPISIQSVTVANSATVSNSNAAACWKCCHLPDVHGGCRWFSEWVSSFLTASIQCTVNHWFYITINNSANSNKNSMTLQSFSVTFRSMSFPVSKTVLINPRTFDDGGRPIKNGSSKHPQYHHAPHTKILTAKICKLGQTHTPDPIQTQGMVLTSDHNHKKLPSITKERLLKSQ